MRRALTGLGVALATGVAWADVVVQPVGILLNTAGETEGFEAVHLIEMDGMRIPYVSCVTDAEAYIPIADHVDEGEYWGAEVFVKTGTMRFDLGEPKLISGFLLWQSTSRYSQDIETFALSVDGVEVFRVPFIPEGSPGTPCCFPLVFRFDPVVASEVDWSFHNRGNGFGTIARQIAFISPHDPCVADTNRDGVLDNGDISAFVNAFLASLPQADINGDGVVDNADLIAFVNAYIDGCPGYGSAT